MRHTRCALLGTVLLSLAAPVAATAQADPLPSWNDGPAKRAILEFVDRVTTPGRADYVPPAERIATFDNDGTLWAEQPLYFQAAFMIDRIRTLAARHPEWREAQPHKAALEGDLSALASAGEPALQEILAATHAGMTTEEFQRLVADWISSARHPRFGRPYTDLVYQPMGELLVYLRDKGFKTFIVSGGGVEFMRVWAERVYGMPPEQVVGSSVVTKLETDGDGVPRLAKLPKVEFVDDGPGKPAGIHRFIGRRPIFAFGNSDGDRQMLEWTAAGAGARFAGIVHHTDAAREWAYDRDSRIGRLDEALDQARAKGWTVVDMARDWSVVFPFARR